jgi:hypothetical protein
MKLEICFVLRGQNRVRILWKPRVLTSSSKIMAKAITQSSRERLQDAYPGEDIVGSRSIQLFHLATGGAQADR